MPYNTILYSTKKLQYHTIQYQTIIYCKKQYHAMQYQKIQNSTVQCLKIQCIPYNTLQNAILCHLIHTIQYHAFAHLNRVFSWSRLLVPPLSRAVLFPWWVPPSGLGSLLNFKRRSNVFSMLNELESKVLKMNKTEVKQKPPLTCFFCKKPNHVKKECRKYIEWKKKNPDHNVMAKTLKENVTEEELEDNPTSYSCLMTYGMDINHI